MTRAAGVDRDRGSSAVEYGLLVAVIAAVIAAVVLGLGGRVGDAVGTFKLPTSSPGPAKPPPGGGSGGAAQQNVHVGDGCNPVGAQGATGSGQAVLCAAASPGGQGQWQSASG